MSWYTESLARILFCYSIVLITRLVKSVDEIESHIGGHRQHAVILVREPLVVKYWLTFGFHSLEDLVGPGHLLLGNLLIFGVKGAIGDTLEILKDSLLFLNGCQLGWDFDIFHLVLIFLII